MLHRPTGDPERSALAIAGDDEPAKRSVAGFLDSIGYNALDVGPLAEGWRFQRDTAAYVQPYAVPGTAYPTWSARPLAADMLQEKLQAAQRYRDMRVDLRSAGARRHGPYAGTLSRDDNMAARSLSRLWTHRSAG